MGAILILTAALIEKEMSKNGGYRKAQLRVFGFCTWVKGWKKSLIGKDVSIEKYQEFLRLRDSESTKIEGFGIDEQY